MGNLSSRNPAGALVTTVCADSPAARAGVMPGDSIVGINHEPVSSYNDVIRIVAESIPGSLVGIDVIRGTTPLSLSARLASVADVLPASFVSVKTSAQSCSGMQCNSTGSSCGQYYYYRPYHRSYLNRSYSCGRSYCGGYRYRHHGCHSGCR
jgi:hypothetical protein